MSDRVLVVVTLVAFLAVFGVATGSFTQVDATRDVTVQTGDGYVGVDTPSGSVAPGQGVRLLTVTNRFDTVLESVSVQVLDGSEVLSDISTPIELGTRGTDGDSGDVTADVACSGGETTVELALSVSGEGVSVETSRTITVACPTATPTDTPTPTPTDTPTPTPTPTDTQTSG